MVRTMVYGSSFVSGSNADTTCHLWSCLLMSSVDTDLIKQKCTYVKVTSLEQLSLAEFSREKTRQKVFESGYKNVLPIDFDLVLKVKCSKFWFLKLFFYVKNHLNLCKLLFVEKYRNGRTTFLTYFDKFDFQHTLPYENVPKFWCLIPDRTKFLKHFYGVFS